MESNWRIVILEEAETWIRSLLPDQRDRVAAALNVLERLGPALGRPKVDSVRGSRHANMKEFREGTIRFLFAFDPTRAAIVLIGGDKKNQWKKWYAATIPRADALFDQWLASLEE